MKVLITERDHIVSYIWGLYLDDKKGVRDIVYVPDNISEVDAFLKRYLGKTSVTEFEERVKKWITANPRRMSWKIRALLCVYDQINSEELVKFRQEAIEKYETGKKIIIEAESGNYNFDEEYITDISIDVEEVGFFDIEPKLYKYVKEYRGGSASGSIADYRETVCLYAPRGSIVFDKETYRSSSQRGGFSGSWFRGIYFSDDPFLVRRRGRDFSGNRTESWNYVY